MGHAKNETAGRRGTTLVELTVATAIIATVFAAVMPLFVGIRNSAEVRWSRLETIQNARILNEQLSRHLACARRITTVGADSRDDGYIEFEAADGVMYRCARGDDGFVEFGPLGDLNDLAGPVDGLRFVCYDGKDVDTLATTPETARLVVWEAKLPRPGSMTNDRIVRGSCHLRVAMPQGSGIVEP